MGLPLKETGFFENILCFIINIIIIIIIISVCSRILVQI